MLLDALRAELWRFSRHTTMWMWGLIVIPVGSAVFGIIYRQFLHGQIQVTPQGLPQQVINMANRPIILGDIITEQLTQVAGINLLALFLLAAAAIAAAEYRWECWRLVRPRNSRRNLILGKMLAIALVAIIPLCLFIFFELIGQIITASMENRKISLGMDLKLTFINLLMLLVAWIRTIQVGVLALLAAIATRSLFGGYVIPIAFAVGTFMVQRMMLGFGWKADEWRTLLLFPASGHEAVQTYLTQGPITFASFALGLLGLVLWIAVPLILAIWLFERQDLSKE